MKLPKTLFIKQLGNDVDDEEFFDVAREVRQFAEIGETVTVGMYQLIDTVDVRTQVTSVTTTKSRRAK